MEIFKKYFSFKSSIFVKKNIPKNWKKFFSFFSDGQPILREENRLIDEPESGIGRCHRSNQPLAHFMFSRKLPFFNDFFKNFFFTFFNTQINCHCGRLGEKEIDGKCKLFLTILKKKRDTFLLY